VTDKAGKKNLLPAGDEKEEKGPSGSKNAIFFGGRYPWEEKKVLLGEGETSLRASTVLSGGGKKGRVAFLLRHRKKKEKKLVAEEDRFWVFLFAGTKKGKNSGALTAVKKGSLIEMANEVSEAKTAPSREGKERGLLGHEAAAVNMNREKMVLLSELSPHLEEEAKGRKKHLRYLT